MPAASAALATLLLDQISKAYAHSHVARAGDIVVAHFLTITAGWNKGVAFGVAQTVQAPLLIIAALIIMAGVTFLLVRAPSRLHQMGFAMINGGALGNVADRFRFGAVRDFIDVHWNAWHWPTFNLADAFIFVGIAIVFLPHKAITRSRNETDVV